MKRRMMLSTNAVTSSISTSEQCWPTSSISSLAKGQRSKPWNTVHIHQAATVEDRMFPSWKCWSLLRKACHVDIDKSMKPMGFWLWRRIFHLLIILSWGNRHGNGISCVAILQSESWNQTCCSWRRLLPMGHIKSTCQDDKEPHGIFRCHLWPPIKLFDSVYVPSVAIVSPTFCVSKRCHKQTFLCSTFSVDLVLQLPGLCESFRKLAQVAEVYSIIPWRKDPMQVQKSHKSH